MKRILLPIFLLLIPLISAYHMFVNGDSLLEGDAVAYKTNDGIYIIQLLIISDSQNATKFKVNDEVSYNLEIGQSQEFHDGSVIILKDILKYRINNIINIL